MKKFLSTACILAILLTTATGCGSGAASSTAPAPEASVSAPAAESSADAAVPEASTDVAATSATSEKGGEFTADSFNYNPVENTEGKEIRIAAICVQNNPFWVDVTAGSYAAKAVLALPQYNATVDYISANDFDGQVFSDAIEACIVKGYDAITTVGVSDAIVPSIDKAVAAGIPVYTFNSDTAKESQRTAFVGQDLYSAGVLAGETLADMIGGEGKVGIITGMYSVNAHELRRKGGEEGLAKSAGITVVGTVENNDSGDEAYTATKNLLTANPDLKGIYVTAGGPHGAAKAIQELGKTDEIALVCFDFTDEIIAYLRTGDINATIGQDPFGQGSDPIILAYNQIVTGTPEVTGNAFTKMDVVTRENVGEFFPE